MYRREVSLHVEGPIEVTTGLVTRPSASVDVTEVVLPTPTPPAARVTRSPVRKRPHDPIPVTRRDVPPGVGEGGTETG